MTQERWVRAPEHDKRVAWGDDYAGDAWLYIATGEIRWTVVNAGPPTPWPADIDTI